MKSTTTKSSELNDEDKKLLRFTSIFGLTPDKYEELQKTNISMASDHITNEILNNKITSSVGAFQLDAFGAGYLSAAYENMKLMKCEGLVDVYSIKEYLKQKVLLMNPEGKFDYNDIPNTISIDEATQLLNRIFAVSRKTNILGPGGKIYFARRENGTSKNIIIE